MGQNWGPPPVTAWLVGRVPGFLAAQKNKTVSAFKKETRDMFFDQWDQEKEAREWEEAHKQAEQEEEAEMLAANRTTRTATQEKKREARKREREERAKLTTYELWKKTRVSVR